MQENNFEKQVRQKMDELSINPSEELWQKVSIAITKRKGDRRVFAFTFFLLLLIGTGIYFTWNQITDRKINNALVKNPSIEKMSGTNRAVEDNNLPKKNDSALHERSRAKVSTGGQDSVQKTILMVIEKGNQKSKPSQKNALGEEKEIPGHNTGDAVIAEKKNRGNSNAGSNPFRPEPLIVVYDSDVEDFNETTAYSPRINKSQPKLILPLTNLEVINEMAPGSTGKEITDFRDPLVIEAATLSPNEKNQAEIKSLQVKHTPAWRWGFNFSLGGAASQDGVLGIIGIGNNNDSKAFADQSQSNNGSTGSTTVPAIPSDIKPGVGIIMGIYLQKNITQKMNFLIGLNYKKYGSSMLIGNRYDSINNMNYSSAYYRSGSSTRYNNNFHFIELPVSMQFILSKQNRLPIYLQTGISIAQLIGTNALQFEPRSGSYFGDNNQLNKTQMNLSGSILFALSKSKNPFLLGPDINFSINKMANGGLYKNSHYSYLGIVVQKGIGKN